MPNRTIYVSDDDRELYDRAAEIAGGFSPAVSEALRRYVETHDLADRGFEEVEVTVRTGGTASVKIFRGRRLARVEQFLEGRSVQWTSYATPRENIAVTRTESPDFIGLAQRGRDAVLDRTGFDPVDLLGRAGRTTRQRGRSAPWSAVDDLGGLFAVLDRVAGDGGWSSLAGQFLGQQGQQGQQDPSGRRGFDVPVPLSGGEEDQRGDEETGDGAEDDGATAAPQFPRLPTSCDLEVFASTAELRDAAFRGPDSRGPSALPVSFITATEQALDTPPVEFLDI